jgi:lipopolysaccharide export system permease protein
MTLIERYLFRQLLVSTLWAVAALAGVGILSQSLSGLELIVEQRQSAWVFAKITLLAMPKTLSLITPLALFVASLITLNRLQAEQEIIVCYAGGVSRWRVASPALRLATWFALLTLVANLWIQPLASRNMRAELNAARADLAAALVREGRFTTPAEDLTVYAQEVERGGALKNLFINHEENPGEDVTYTAREGRLTKRNGSPVLVMKDGATQRFSDKGVLNYLSFDEYIFDLRPFMGTGAAPTTKASDRYISELLHPAAKDEWAQKNAGVMLAEVHGRIASPLYNLTFMAFAISAVLGGGFSRLGYAKRIAWMSAVAVFFRILGFVAQEAASSNAALNIVQYLVPAGGFALALSPFLLGRPRRPRSRPIARHGLAQAPA